MRKPKRDKESHFQIIAQELESSLALGFLLIFCHICGSFGGIRLHSASVGINVHMDLLNFLTSVAAGPVTNWIFKSFLSTASILPVTLWCL